MTTPPKLSVEEMYTSVAASAEYEAILNGSLALRGPDMMFDMAAALGISSESVVLDVGCRDGRHLVALHRRFGCRVVGVELIAANLARAPAVVGSVPAELVRGTAEQLPFVGASFDLVWVRDVLSHIEALASALAECRRVLQPGGAVLVYHVLATPSLEPIEADLLWGPLAVVHSNANAVVFERAIEEAGLRVETRDELRSEWREFLEEQGHGRTGRQLLVAARLLRQPERFKSALGEKAYAVELSNALWGVYLMIGKLSAVLYVLRRNPDSSGRR